jgi:hypothetical protein
VNSGRQYWNSGAEGQPQDVSDVNNDCHRFRCGRAQGSEKAVRSYDAMIVRALAALGRRDEGEAIMSRLAEESRQHYVRGEILAMGYAAIGDFDSAFASLDRAFQARSAGLIYLHLDPGYEPLRTDSRFHELVERIGQH